VTHCCVIFGQYTEIMCYAGASGNILINNQAYREQSFTIWGYTEGLDAYYAGLVIDLTQAPGQVSHNFSSESVGAPR